MKYYVEDLLRPPVEYYAAISYLLAAGTFVVAPYMVSAVGESLMALALFCFVRGGWRFKQAIKLRRYQKRLRRLKPLVQDYGRIPAVSESYYMGHGFAWSQPHTQRLVHLEKPEYRHHTQPNRNSRLRASLESLELSLVDSFLSSRAGQIMLPKPLSGGRPELHAVGLWEGENPVYFDIGAGGQHTLVYGRTRSGKSYYLQMLVAQDIRRKTRDAVIVINPKGGSELLVHIWQQAALAGRLDDLVIFSLAAPELSAVWDASGRFSRITEIATRTADKMPQSSASQAFTAFVWRYVHVIVKTLKDLKRPIDYKTIKRYAEDFESLALDAIRSTVDQIPGSDRRIAVLVDYFGQNERQRQPIDNPPSVPRSISDRDTRVAAYYAAYRESDRHTETLDSVCKILEHERGHFDKLVASLLPFLEKICADPVGSLIAPAANNDKPRLNWREAISQRKIVYVDLDALTDPEIAQVIGNLMFSDLTSLAGDIYRKDKASRVIIHADEFNELMGREFIPLLNKAGGAGYTVFCYTQTMPDMQTRLDSEAHTFQAIGNFSRVVCFGLRDQKTADSMSKWLRKVRIEHLLLGSGTSGAGDLDPNQIFRANTIQRRQQEYVDSLQPNDFSALMIGHAFIFSDGALYKIRVPAQKPRPIDLPNSVLQVIHRLDERRTSATDWYTFTPSFDLERAVSASRELANAA